MSEEDNTENFHHNEHQSEGEQRRDETRAGGGAKSLASVRQLQRRASVVKSSTFCQQLFAARIQIKLSLYE